MPTLVDGEVKLKFGPPELGTVLYCPGLPGGGSKLYDRSPYGNQGTITGASWVRLSSGLWCLSFDGSDDDVDLGKDASLSILGDLTIKFWSKCNLSTDVFVSNANAAASKCQYAVLTGGNGNKIRWQSLNAGSNDDFDALGADRGAGWVQTIFTLSGTDLVYYLNGADQSISKTVTNRCSEADRGNTFLGRQGDWGAAGDLLGQMALEEIVNGRAWTALEAINSFNREKHLFGVW